jgi:hypothetical protein
MKPMNEIKSYILKHVKQHPQDIVAVAAKHFNVTRTTIHRHLTALLLQNKLFKSGNTKQVKYFLPATLTYEKNYKISSSLSEFLILDQDFSFIANTLPQNIEDIFSYGFTEIFNNAIDHSHGTNIFVKAEWVKDSVVLTIADNGIGIFQYVYDHFHLDDIRESILQLSKGKITTDPANHTGEGLFFTSRAFDTFEIYANGLYYMRNNTEQDWSFRTWIGKTKGTTIKMTINKNATLLLKELFELYQDEDSLAFNKTEIIIKLAQFEEETLISRSQAKRITFNLEKFNRVVLDFRGIRLVGQGFVDQLFRVYATAHPKTTIEYINANEDVEFMIRRGIGTSKRQQ